MEIRFCDLCAESIPDSDFDAGRAVAVNGRTYHVTCALRRALALGGWRSWMTFLLALYAAGVVTFLLVVFLGPKPEKPDVVSPAVETAIAGSRSAVETSLRRVLSEGLAATVKDAGSAADARTSVVRKEIRAQLDVLQARLEASDALASDHLKAQAQRLDRIEGEVSALSALLREVKEEAEREAARRRARPVPTPPKPESATREPTPVRPPVAPPDKPAGANTQAVTRWIRRLKDANENIRFSATLELGRLKDRRASAPLVEVLQKDRDYYVRLGAATALGDIKAVDAFPALVDALNDRDGLVRTAANDALQSITEQAYALPPGMSKGERRRLQKKWRSWFKENEAGLRDRLGQPAAK
ncbi:MAG: HEAT repeat domain-containing protein [Planctomycetota bacterium]